MAERQPESRRTESRSEKNQEDKGEKKAWRPQPRPGNPQQLRGHQSVTSPTTYLGQGTASSKERDGGLSSTDKKPQKVVYHKLNDLSEAKTLVFDPKDYEPKKKRTHKIISDYEKELNPCEMMKSYKYGNWIDTVFPVSDNNIVRGMAHALSLIIQAAAKGPQSIDHDKAFLGIQFLTTIRNDAGEYPPNVLAFIEYIDYYTRNDDSEKLEDPFQTLD